MSACVPPSRARIIQWPALESNALCSDLKQDSVRRFPVLRSPLPVPPLTRESSLRLLRFLDLPDDRRSEFPRTNTRRRRRWWRPREFVRSVRDSLIGSDGPLPQVPASAAFRAELREHFRDEAKLLGDLTGRDLSLWY